MLGAPGQVLPLQDGDTVVPCAGRRRPRQDIVSRAGPWAHIRDTPVRAAAALWRLGHLHTAVFQDHPALASLVLGSHNLRGVGKLREMAGPALRRVHCSPVTCPGCPAHPGSPLETAVSLAPSPPNPRTLCAFNTWCGFGLLCCSCQWRGFDGHPALLDMPPHLPGRGYMLLMGSPRHCRGSPRHAQPTKLNGGSEAPAPRTSPTLPEPDKPW